VNLSSSRPSAAHPSEAASRCRDCSRNRRIDRGESSRASDSRTFNVLAEAANQGVGAVVEAAAEAGAVAEEAAAEVVEVVDRSKFVALSGLAESATMATPCHGMAARYHRNCRELLSRLPSSILNRC